VIPLFEAAFVQEFRNANLSCKLEAGEKLYIYYPSVFSKDSAHYVKDNVLIEFGGSNKTEPNEKHTVKPYLSIEGLIFPSAEVSVFSPARTFWEKVTLIHVECHRGRLIGVPDRLSRHWYDLAMLSQSWVKDIALQDRALLDDVLMVKKAFFNASYANYEKCENKNFCLIPNVDETAQLKSDYMKMSDSGMFLNEPVSFYSLIMQLQKLQSEINQI
jgi:hypothetical protein